MKQYYLVLNITNYGSGYMIGGLYSSRKLAEKRLLECEKQCGEEDADSWRVVEVGYEPIRAEVTEKDSWHPDF